MNGQVAQSLQLSSETMIHFLLVGNNRLGIFSFDSQYLNVNSSELWSMMNQEARQNGVIGDRMNVAAIMKTWTGQSGYPVVHCLRTVDNKLRLYQVCPLSLSLSLLIP